MLCVYWRRCRLLQCDRHKKIEEKFNDRKSPMGQGGERSLDEVYHVRSMFKSRMGFGPTITRSTLGIQWDCGA